MQIETINEIPTVSDNAKSWQRYKAVEIVVPVGQNLNCHNHFGK